MFTRGLMVFKVWQPINQPMVSSREVGMLESPFSHWPYRVKWS